MANPVEASAPVAVLAPDVPPPPPPPPLPEHPVVGTSETGAGVQGQSNLDAGVHGICQRALGVVNSGAHAGVLGEAWNGPGISGFSVGGDGVFGHGPSGVHGASNDPTFRGVGVLGEHPSAGIGVKGTSISGAGVEAISESGAGINAVSTTGAGVSAISSAGTGVQGVSRPPVLLPGPITGDGVVGIGKNGVHGESSSPTDSGVWGDNLSSGYGVSGSSVNGNGVIGLAARAPTGGGTTYGVIGRTTSDASGVWGDNTGTGAGVAGTSVQGNGVIGRSTHGSGVVGLAAGTSEPGHGPNGVIGRTSSGSDSGVWGDNAGSGPGATGTSGSGTGVVGQGGFNGVQGVTANSSASGVWGENTGSGKGVGGQSASGVGVYGKGTPAAQFDGNVIINGGDLTMNGGDIRLPGADCAEQFDIAGARQLDPGTVAVIDKDGALRESTEAYDRKVAGVVSGAGELRPGIVLDQRQAPESRAPLALVGKVYCKVDACYSPIVVGDLLTTSTTPGHAMKAGDPLKAFGAVIGKALRPLLQGQGLIPILIALQ